MIGYIYLITDTTNGMKYVGQHHYDKEELDPNYHGSGNIIKKIYKKRPETLKYEYVKTCFTQTEMDEWEKYFIFTNDTLYPNGYNLRDGGNGKEFSETTLQKLSESHKWMCGEKHNMYGKHRSDETKRKISEAHKGKPSYMKGKHHTEEARKKMSEARKGIYPSEETRKKLSESLKGKKAVKVLQYTLSGEFVCEWNSMIEIEKQFGFSHTNISKCCSGYKKTAYGYIWRYKEKKEVV